MFAENDAGLMVLTGGRATPSAMPRWRIESVRWPVLISAAIVRDAARHDDSVARWPVAPAREARRFWWLKFFLLLCAVAFVLPVIGVMNVRDDRRSARRNVWTAAMFAGSLLMPAAAILSFLFTVDAWRSGAGRGCAATRSPSRSPR